MRLGGLSAIEDKMIREKVNGRSHHTSRASRPKSGTAESVRSVVSRCHAVPNDLRQLLDSRREETRASNMAMSHDPFDSSIPALVKRGFIGLMQIGEIDGLVIAWREVNVAQHLSAIGTFALDANCEGGTLSLLTQDSAKTKRGVDLVSGYRHPCRIRPITRARRVFRVSANNREVVFSEHLCCERRERYNAQHSGRNHLFSPSHCTLLPRGHCIVLLQSEAVRLVPHALAETASHPDWGGREFQLPQKLPGRDLLLST